MLQICENIRLARVSKKLDQQDVADKLRVTRSTYKNWEKGTEPNLKIIKDIAAAIGVPAYILLKGVIDFSEDKTEIRPDLDFNFKLPVEQVDLLRSSLSVLDSIFSLDPNSSTDNHQDVQEKLLEGRKKPLLIKPLKNKQKGSVK